ncbi:discoidin domain-containing protein [Actinoplanes sp. NPDC049118]|uniref:discoidin domain-containing protein n=1 Tax=Actinoplanes sp. NPDC049118 TaxID=3155769 RepID=UPI0033DDE8C9
MPATISFPEPRCIDAEQHRGNNRLTWRALSKDQFLVAVSIHRERVPLPSRQVGAMNPISLNAPPRRGAPHLHRPRRRPRHRARPDRRLGRHPGRCRRFVVVAGQGRDGVLSGGRRCVGGQGVDGDAGSRWSSQFSDPQWLQVDLGATATVSQVVLQWEGAYGRAYKIQTSADATTWTDIYATTTGTGGTETLTVTGTGRYVRMYGTTRASGYGYSLYEFKVFTTGGTTTPPVEPTDPRNPNLGPNVNVFDPSTPRTTRRTRSRCTTCSSGSAARAPAGPPTASWSTATT